MSMEFEFYDDTPAQNFLDDLHAIDVPKLFDPDLTKEQRVNLIKLKKGQLSEWQAGLTAQLREIHGRYDADQATEQRLALAPYKTLDNLGKELTKAIKRLEDAVKRGRMLPQGFGFGTLIFGEPEWGEWHLGEREEADAFEEMVSIKTRMDMVDEEYMPMVKSLKLSQGRIKELKRDLAGWMREYKQRKRPLYIGGRIFVRFGFAIAFVVMGWLLFSAEAADGAAFTNRVVGGALLVLGVTLLMMSVVLLRRNRRQVAELEEDIKNGRRRLKQLQQEFKGLRVDYYPTNQLRQELAHDYKALRVNFPRE